MQDTIATSDGNTHRADDGLVYLVLDVAICRLNDASYTSFRIAETDIVLYDAVHEAYQCVGDKMVGHGWEFGGPNTFTVTPGGLTTTVESKFGLVYAVKEETEGDGFVLTWTGGNAPSVRFTTRDSTTTTSATTAQVSGQLAPQETSTTTTIPTANDGVVEIRVQSASVQDALAASDGTTHRPEPGWVYLVLNVTFHWHHEASYSPLRIAEAELLLVDATEEAHQCVGDKILGRGWEFGAPHTVTFTPGGLTTTVDFWLGLVYVVKKETARGEYVLTWPGQTATDARLTISQNTTTARASTAVIREPLASKTTSREPMVPIALYRHERANL
jgi:hypothetical protein